MKRTSFVAVRFSRPERAAVKRAAKDEGATVSDFIRARVLRGVKVVRDDDSRQLPLYPRGGAFQRKR